MNKWLWLFLLGAVVGFGWYLVTAKKRRRMKLRQMPLTSEDWKNIEKYAQVVSRLPREHRSKLEGITQVLLAEKNYEAWGGLEEVTREMMVVTMAQAALLLVGREHRFYPRLRSVLFYPQQFGDEEGTRLGESWGSGSVILSWKSVRQGGADHRDGHNVVIHEFAHQLDQETGWGDGVPYLEERGDYQEWAKIFQAAYEDFCQDVEAGRKTVLDDYGATNPAEFFAVATETFFEKAEQLKEQRPHVYAQMERYYGLDPASWS